MTLFDTHTETLRERDRRTREGVDIVTDTGRERLLVQERERAHELSESERARVHF